MVRGAAKAASQQKKAAKDADKEKSGKRDASEVTINCYAFYLQNLMIYICRFLFYFRVSK